MEFSGLIKKEVELGVIKKKLCGVFRGLRSLPYNFQEGVPECGIFSGEACFVLVWNSTNKPRNPRAFFRKVCPPPPLLDFFME